jgi:DNA-directed RNA polymerase subunit RPC12/RpoP
LDTLYDVYINNFRGDLMIIGSAVTKKGTKKELIDYKCRFCGNKFSQYVLKTGKQKESAKRGDVSDQVKCPKCGNFMKTWK